MPIHYYYNGIPHAKKKDPYDFPMSMTPYFFKPGELPNLFSKPYVHDVHITPWYEPDAKLTAALRIAAKQSASVRDRIVIAKYATLLPVKNALKFPDLDTGRGYWNAHSLRYFTFVQKIVNKIKKKAEAKGDEATIEALDKMGFNPACMSPYRPDISHTKDFETDPSDPRLQFGDIFQKVVWSAFWKSFDYCLDHPEVVHVTAKRSSSMGVSETVDGIPITKDADPQTGNMYPMASPYDNVLRLDNNAIREGYLLNMESPYGCYQLTSVGLSMMQYEGGEWTPKNVRSRVEAHQDRTGTTGIRKSSQDGKSKKEGCLDQEVVPTRDRPFEIALPGYREAVGEGNNEALANLLTSMGYVGKLDNSRRFIAMRSDVQMGPAFWAKAWLYQWEESASSIPSTRANVINRYLQFLRKYPEAIIFCADRHNAEKYITSNRWIAEAILPSGIYEWLAKFHGTKITGSRTGARMHQFIMASGDAFTTFWNVLYGCFTKLCLYVHLVSTYYGDLTETDRRSLYEALAAHLFQSTDEISFRDFTFCLFGSTDDVMDLIYCPLLRKFEQWEDLYEKAGLPELDKAWQLATELSRDHVAFGLRVRCGTDASNSDQEAGVMQFTPGTLAHLVDPENPGIPVKDISQFCIKAEASGYDAEIDEAIREMEFPWARSLSDLMPSIDHYFNWLHQSGLNMADDVNLYSPAEAALYEQTLHQLKGGLTSADPRTDTVKMAQDVKLKYLDLANILRRFP